jgi:hypothetical protein
MAVPDVFVRFTATIPKRLLAAVDKRAAALGLARAAYLANLARADLVGADIAPPAPPPRKQHRQAKKSSS